MNKILTEPRLAPFRQSIIDSAMPVANIELIESENLAPWQSNFAGQPYLPKGMAYPMHPEGYPLRLLIQINFAEVPPLPDFPTKGILQIFADPRYLHFDDFIDQSKHQIIYHPTVTEDIAQLQTDIVIEEKFDYIEHTSGIRFMPSLQYSPCGENEAMTIVSGEGKRLYDDDSLRALYYKSSGDYYGGNYLSGYPYFNQYDPRFEWEGYLSYQYEGEELERMTKKYQRLKENVLLLQLDGGDKRFCGSGFSCNFFIHPDDLKSRDFSKIYGHLDAD